MKLLSLSLFLVCLSVILFACSGEPAQKIEEEPQDITMLSIYTLLQGSLVNNLPFPLEEAEKLFEGMNFYQSKNNEHVWTVEDNGEWVMMYFDNDEMLINMTTNIFD